MSRNFSNKKKGVVKGISEPSKKGFHLTASFVFCGVQNNTKMSYRLGQRDRSILMLPVGHYM
jgi:hypothetical protein